MIKKCIIPAAGFGTRFLPITKATSKEMLPIIDKPVIAYLVEEAIASGIEEIIIIISPNKEDIRQYFERNYELEDFLVSKNKADAANDIRNFYPGIKFYFVYQLQPLGLGHAIFKAKEIIGSDDFAVMLGDDLYVCQKPALQQLIEVYNQIKATILGTQVVPINEAHQYGVCIPHGEVVSPLTKLIGLIEKPVNPPSTLTISGRYILTNQIMKLLATQTKGANGEIQLTDAIAKLMPSNKVFAYEIAGIRYDCGSKIGYFEAILDFALVRSDLKDCVKNLIISKSNTK